MINGTGASVYDLSKSGNIGIRTWFQTKGNIKLIKASATRVIIDLYLEIKKIFFSKSTHSNKKIIFSWSKTRKRTLIASFENR